MLTKEPVTRTELLAYLVLMTGVLGDQITTRIGLARPGITESNQLVNNLMNIGVWLPLDMVFILFIIGTVFVALRSFKNPYTSYLLVFPILAGLVRLYVTLLNLAIIL